MEEITYEEFREAATGIDPTRFLKAVDRYFKAPAERNAFRRFFSKSETDPPSLPEMASEVMNRATLSISRLINYRFEPRSRGKMPVEKEILIRHHFHQLKKHQIELLFSISDDVELISALIMKSDEVKNTLRGFSPTLRQASQLMDVLRERLVQRPTTLLRLAGGDRKIRELNETVRDIVIYEQSREKFLGDQADRNGDLYNGCEAPLRQLMNEVAMLRHRVTRSLRELKRGGKLLARLASKGYSPFMKRSLTLLTRNHQKRMKDFHEQIVEIRLSHYIAG